MPEKILFRLYNINSPRHPPANYLKRLIDKINTASIAAQNCQKRHYDIRAPYGCKNIDTACLLNSSLSFMLTQTNLIYLAFIFYPCLKKISILKKY